MANLDTPFGLRPIKNIDGSPYNGKVYTFYVPSTDSTALFLGDPVILAGSSNTALYQKHRPGSLPTVTKATEGATNRILGYVVGVVPETAESTKYRVASTERAVFVALARDLIVEAQADEDIVAGDIGADVDFIDNGSGDTVSGQSTVEADSSSIGAGATKQFHLLRLRDISDIEGGNELGDYAKVELLCNLPQYSPGTAGV